jgi:hypothetical protein
MESCRFSLACTQSTQENIWVCRVAVALFNIANMGPDSYLLDVIDIDLPGKNTGPMTT